MAIDSSFAGSMEPEKYDVPVRLLGTGAAAPTIEVGRNFTISRTGVGDYKLTFTDHPGPYVNFTYGLEATTRSAMFGCTVIGKYTAPTATARGFLEISLASGGTTPAARELAAAEKIHLVVNFKRKNI